MRRGFAKENSYCKKREESQQERIATAKDDLTAAETELAQLPVYEPPKEEIERLGACIRELEVSASEKRSLKRDKVHMLDQERSTLNRCLTRLKDIENTKTRLLQALKNSGASHIFEAVEWVRNHSNEFNEKIHGPVLLEVNVSNKSHTAYLEGHVPYYIWKSFITQDPHDRDLLVKNLKPFDIPVLNYTGNRQMQNKPLPVSDAMRKLGITSRLDEVFEAPSAVKEVLISQAVLEHSFIGSEETNHRADDANKLGVMDLWTPENHYRWSISRYGGHISTSVNPVYGSRLFASNVDVREVNELMCKRRECEEHIARIDEGIKSISTEQRHLEDEAANLHRKREDIVNNVRLERRKRQEMANRIDQRKRNIEAWKAQGATCWERFAQNKRVSLAEENDQLKTKSHIGWASKLLKFKYYCTQQ